MPVSTPVDAKMRPVPHYLMMGAKLPPRVTGDTPLARALSLLVPPEDVEMLRQVQRGDSQYTAAKDADVPRTTAQRRLKRARLIADLVFGPDAEVPDDAAEVPR